MKDTDLQNIVLQKFYEKRSEGWVSVTATEFGLYLTDQEVLRISEQLSQSGRIDFKSNPDHRKQHGGIAAGMGRINASGIDAIEREPSDQSLKISVMHDNRVNVSGSTGVVIGDNNNQSITDTFTSILNKIECSHATDAEKREAKSLLKQFFENPVVAAVVGATASVVLAKLGAGI
jgi:hypothetical protein